MNFGDGGYTQISPDNEESVVCFQSSRLNFGDQYFQLHQFRMESVVTTQDFQNNPVVNSATVGGDTGPYYPVYILDPQNPGEMIVGTCRMWRGSSAGGAFTVLSHSFETGGDGICTGAEINLVRSLAVGGAAR